MTDLNALLARLKGMDDHDFTAFLYYMARTDTETVAQRLDQWQRPAGDCPACGHYDDGVTPADHQPGCPVSAGDDTAEVEWECTACRQTYTGDPMAHQCPAADTARPLSYRAGYISRADISPDRATDRTGPSSPRGTGWVSGARP